MDWSTESTSWCVTGATEAEESLPSCSLARLARGRRDDGAVGIEAARGGIEVRRVAAGSRADALEQGVELIHGLRAVADRPDRHGMIDGFDDLSGPDGPEAAAQL